MYLAGFAVVGTSYGCSAPLHAGAGSAFVLKMLLFSCVSAEERWLLLSLC